MTFDEWTSEARRSLEAWNPEPVVRPLVLQARSGVGVDSVAEPGTEVCAELAPEGGRRPAEPRRRLLPAAAAAVVVAAAALAVLAIPSADQGTDVAVGSQGGLTQPSVEPTDPGPSSGPRFECSAVGPDGEPSGASTDVFDDATDVATWRAVDIDGPTARPSVSTPAKYVEGTLVGSEGEDLAQVRARGASFVAALAPGWGCTLWSPAVDVADPSRPGPIIEDNVLTNRLGGMCFVPDATTSPDEVWGVDPTLAGALDQVDGLTDWRVILADGGGNSQGPGRLWMEFTFDADPSIQNDEATARIVAAVAAAVDAAGDAAGVSTECTAH